MDEEAEHYCAIHSPPRRRRQLQDKVRSGRDKINSLKQLELNKDIPVRPRVTLQRSVSERTQVRPSALVRNDNQRQRTLKDSTSKVTVNADKKDIDSKKDSLIKNVPDIKINPRSPGVPRRSAPLPK